MSRSPELLVMKGISLSFGKVRALNDVFFCAEAGKVTALMGENGAGKSSLMKVLTGINTHYEGKIYWRGKETCIDSISTATNLGITMIHQELSLLNNLTVYENIFLGTEPYGRITRKINKQQMVRESEELMNYLGYHMDVSQLVGTLSIGDKQMVEFAKAISKKSAIIVMDEPTTALSYKETDKLFEVISRLKSEGLAIVYISHRLTEIFEIADNITVMRDGTYISSVDVCDTNNKELVEMIAGRTITDQYPFVESGVEGEVALELREFSHGTMFQNISLTLKTHSITGLSGLVGSGRTELAKGIMGEIRATSGSILLKGKEVRIRSPKDAIKNGIAMVPEDRKKEGLVLGMSVKDNITLSSLEKYENSWRKLSQTKELRDVKEFVDKLNIKTTDAFQIVSNLSGGNQQKIVIAKFLLIDCDVIIVDEPTRGIDVGAKKDIYDILNELKNQGKAILVISSDLPEVLGISDTIVVMSQGRISGQLSHYEANQQNTMELALGL